MTSAARRASLASSIVQQPRAPERYDAGLRERARWMPVTSWPASTARAAATAESTPPDMAARTFTCFGRPRRARRPGRSPRRPRRRRPRWRCGRARTAASAAPGSSSQPIASSTCEGCGTPAEQAEPVEHSMPRASSSISSESPSQPGKPRWALPGSRCTPAGRGRRRGGARRGPTSITRRTRSSRSAPTRAACSACCLTASSTAAAKPGDRRGVDGAAADVALLAAAVHQRGDRDLAADDERADAVGPADLVRR